MKKTVAITLLLFFLFIIPDTWASHQTIKIACVGNSITYGAGIENREKNCYPAQLQAYLGNQYEVQNFGVSGQTILSKGDYPYIQTQEYKNLKVFQPDIVFIKFGTNDSKTQNWIYKNEFAPDYEALIGYLKSLQSKPRIILLTPIRSFLGPESNIKNDTIELDVRPRIEDLAYRNQLEVVNLYNLFGNVWEGSLMPDKLHPSSIGAGVIAKKLYQYLTYKQEKPKNDCIKALHLEQAKSFNFHGHQGYEFTDNGTTCFIVKPHREAVGRPWMVRARFWGHEPQTDIAMLEHGFYLVYCDVADLYGADKAVKRWDSFYKRMTKAGFNKKVVLEGMSRGGLIVYNWTVQNPEKVACIYADAPVMDIKSWPMGKGSYGGSKEDVEKMMKAYEFKDEAEAVAWKKNPIDGATILAKYRIPIIHVVGDADNIVPVAENTAIFEQRMKALNAPITVIHKPNVNHHPHSLNNPEPIVNFILKATGRSENLCIHAIPGNEYRSGAGWKNGADWHKVAEDITQTLKGKELKLLLLGNSITQGWGGNRTLVGYKPGKPALDSLIGANQWESAGISGDRTENLLWRVRYGNYADAHPKNVVISIGINNLLSGQNEPEEVAEGIIAVARETLKQFPKAHIILLGLLPSGAQPNSPVRLKCDKIHELLAKNRLKGIDYINPTEWFTNADGVLNPEWYSGDYIHLTAKGYTVWASELVKLLH